MRSLLILLAVVLVLGCDTPIAPRPVRVPVTQFAFERQSPPGFGLAVRGVVDGDQVGASDFLPVTFRSSTGAVLDVRLRLYEPICRNPGSFICNQLMVRLVPDDPLPLVTPFRERGALFLFRIGPPFGVWVVETVRGNLEATRAALNDLPEVFGAELVTASQQIPEGRTTTIVRVLIATTADPAEAGPDLLFVESGGTVTATYIGPGGAVSTAVVQIP